MQITEPIRWTLIVWLTVMGGCIGSFLNVVVYRFPLRKNLSRPGSHCPKCDHAIRWWHNIPVVGWLALRGKCFDCGEPIAFRYPAIEALVAFWFGALAWCGPLAGESDAVDATRVCVYALHLLLLCTLLVCLLIELDWPVDGARNRRRYPIGLWMVALLVGVLAPLWSRDLTEPMIWVSPGRLGGGLGAAAGGMLAAAIRAPRPMRLPDAPSTQGFGHLALIGAHLGWLAAWLIGAFAMAVALSGRGRGDEVSRSRLSARWAAIAMLLGATIWTLAWRIV